MNDDVTYGLWLLVSLNSFVLITIVQSLLTCRPRANARIAVRPLHSPHSLLRARLVTGCVQSEN